MKKTMFIAVLALGLVLMSMPAAFAIELGTNITIYDGSGSGTGWYGAQEDQEVEPNCVNNQSWDLEGFFLKGSTLAMVGGYDFAGNTQYSSGDIFFDIDGDYSAGTAPSTNGVQTIANSFGYDYALDLDFSNKEYTVYKLTSSSNLKTVYYQQNQISTPWEYALDGSAGGKGTFDFTYLNLTDSETGFSGGTHYAVLIDLSDWVGTDFDDGFLAHFTMECGNDNLMGAAPVPEPQTLLLMGIGLLGLAFIGRKKLGDRS